ncbi:MAG: hypothetical protein AAGF35_09670 [Pseudomonadota bacterium]
MTLKFKVAAVIVSLLAILTTGGCTEEARNKLGRTTDNVLGKDLKVSYIDGGRVIKTWTVIDGKITSGQGEGGVSKGYYYFWSEETGYVQLPIERTIIEEIQDK